jgi:hypothetical protein
MDYWLSTCRDFKILNTSLDHNLSSLKQNQVFACRDKLEVTIQEFLYLGKSVEASELAVVETMFGNLPLDIWGSEFSRKKDSIDAQYTGLKKQLISQMGNDCVKNNDQLKTGVAVIDGQKSGVTEALKSVKTAILALKHIK